MTTGKIESITTDWRGDTLAAAVTAADTVLTVTDTADFDEDPSTERWLVIGGTAPVRYVDVDDDTNTITLAAPAGATFDAGLPVLVWDPTVPPAGAPAVEYVATVATDRGSVPAVIPHEKIPVSNVENLIGASVSLVEDDDGDDWLIDQVRGREPRLDVRGVIRTADEGQRVELVNAESAHSSSASVELYDGYDPSPGVESEPAVLRAAYTDSAGVTEEVTLSGPPAGNIVGPNLNLQTRIDDVPGGQSAELYALGEVILTAEGSDGVIYLYAPGQGVEVTGLIILDDLATGGASVDAGSRFCRVGDNGRLFASDDPPASLGDALDAIRARLDALEATVATHSTRLDNHHAELIDHEARISALESP